MNIFRVRSCLVLLVAGCLIARAPATEVANKVSEDRAYSEDIDDNLERRARLERQADYVRPPEWLEDFRRCRDEWRIRHGVNLTTSYSVAGLAMVGGGDCLSGMSGDLTVEGMLNMLRRERENPLSLRFRMRHRHAIAGRSAAEVADASGEVFWNMVDGFSGAGFEIPDFELVKELPDHNMEIRLGQMTIDSQFDRHGLRSSKNAFLNKAFSSNPAVGFPRFGSGASLVWHPDERWDISLGFSSVQGTPDGSQVDLDWGSGDFFKVVQLGYDFELNRKPSRVQAMLWHSDSVATSSRPEGQGVAVTFEHWLDSSATRLFVRAALADGGVTGADRLLAAGVAFETPEHDLFGVAAAVGRDASGTKDWQGVVEGFYRFQVGPNFHVTPSAQVIFGSGLQSDNLVRLVGGIRAQVSF